MIIIYLLNILKKKQIYDLLLLFSKNNEKNNKAIFNYLKKRMLLINKNILSYVNANKKFESKTFLQKMISNNLLYLSEKTRMETFKILLSEEHRKSGNINPLREDEENKNKLKIKVNRNKAKAFYDKFNESSEKIPDLELNETIFGQIFKILKDLNGKNFFLEKGRRLFRVDLVGEQAIDVGGPYHEVISCMCDELQSDYLCLFIKTPNNKDKLGELRDKYMINSDLNQIINKKAYEFIGKLMGLAISSGEALNLNLHPIIWKNILEKEIIFDEFETIDLMFVKTIKESEEALKNKDDELLDSFNLSFVININGRDIELKTNGKEIKVNLDNVEEFIRLSKSKKINEFEAQIECIKKGLYSVINENILQLLNWKQLEEMICGQPKLDIKDFKKHTEYHCYKGDEEIIKWFWEWLENSNEETQFKYLRFVSGRTRLPRSGFGFEYTHIISKISIENVYPKSATCFFTLKLPNYNSKDVLIKNIKYAIDNSVEISDAN